MHSPQLTSNNGTIIPLNSPDPAIIHALKTFDLEKFVAENPEMFSAQLTGYPLLFHIMTCIMGHMQGKKILEIGWGVVHAEKNMKYLRKLTDTVDADWKIEHHAYGIDVRNAGKIGSEAILWYDWSELDLIKDHKTGKPLTFDCILNHRIGPTEGGYEKVTDAALNPGGFYIAFRDRESVSNEPVNKKFFLDHEYYDGSFSFRFKEWITRENKEGYDVTIFRKPFKSTSIIRGTQDDTDVILAG